MSVKILGLGTATADHSMSQQEATQLAIEVCDVNQRQQRILEVLYRKSGVRNRRTVLPHRIALDWIRPPQQSAATPTATDSLGPTTRERMEFYEAHAPPMALRAAVAALQKSDLEPAELTHLITVSCTGFVAPGIDVELINHCGLPATTQRVHVGFMGCHGAINGLRVAQALGESNLDARILLCAVECCSLHYRFQWDPDRFIGNALFADGAAALICVPNAENWSGNGKAPPAKTDPTIRVPSPSDPASTSRDAVADKQCTTPIRLIATGSCLIPNTRDAMTWKVGDHGFEMYLSAQVPELIEQHLRPWLSQWLARHDLSIETIGGWAVHPGGPRILQAVQASLGLSADDLAFSWEILASHGNMSSATTLFILDRLRQQDAHFPCVAIGFGPGLVAEAALLGGVGEVPPTFVGGLG